MNKWSLLRFLLLQAPPEALRGSLLPACFPVFQRQVLLRQALRVFLRVLRVRQEPQVLRSVLLPVLALSLLPVSPHSFHHYRLLGIVDVCGGMHLFIFDPPFAGRRRRDQGVYQKQRTPCERSLCVYVDRLAHYVREVRRASVFVYAVLGRSVFL